MKKSTIFLVLLFAVTSTFAQLKTQYFDENWNLLLRKIWFTTDQSLKQ